MVWITLGALLLTILVLWGIWHVWRPNSFGFSQKTLWDWISLLAVPLVVGFATFLISASQIRIQQDRALEEALQRYFLRIGELALDDRLTSRAQMASALGRAETMAILRMVENERAGRVFAFLSEMDLLQPFAVEFEDLDLKGAEMKGLDLAGLDFEDSDLSGADLERAKLVGVDFEGANLQDADLKEADLRRADFQQTKISGALLTAADLRGADLRFAIGLTASQIAQSCLDAATKLPPDLVGTSGAVGICGGD